MQVDETKLLEMFVEDVLEQWPETAPVFLQRRMLCVGCPMARFDTVRDAALIYGIPERVLAQELLEAIGRPASA